MKAVLIFIAFNLVPGSLPANDRLGLPTLPIPADNPQTETKIELGKRLFHERRFSADGTISCASCHQADKAFTDGLTRAIGIGGQIGPRNTPTVVNAAFYASLFLDGRRDSLENQALDPLLNPTEHGLHNHQPIVDIVVNHSTYPALFEKSFAIQPQKITITHVTKAIASYERTLISGNAPFDRYFFASDRKALSDSAARGLKIFRRKGNCANCHEISWNNALFTDNRFYNIGVGFERIAAQLDAYLVSLQNNNARPYNLNNQQRSELGRFSVTRVVSDIGKFRTPTLRNIALTAPYMHDGSQKTLQEVIDYYDKGGNKNPYLDPAIFPLELTQQEKLDLVEFLKSLTSPAYSDTAG